MLVSYCTCSCLLRDYSADIKESQNIASLHKQIAACDQILEVCRFISFLVCILSIQKCRSFYHAVLTIAM